MSDASFTIGADRWSGLAKIMEETGELQQVLCKIMAFPDLDYPDGSDLGAMLIEELADVAAALTYFVRTNDLPVHVISARRRAKVDKFVSWHEREQV